MKHFKSLPDAKSCKQVQWQNPSFRGETRTCALYRELGVEKNGVIFGGYMMDIID